MAESELSIAGIGISRAVIAAVVAIAAEKVEGVASVGQRATASSLVSVFFQADSITPISDAVTSDVIDDKLQISVRLTVLYGYPFTKLAAVVRKSVAMAVHEQIGIEVASVDVCIDNIVFPKE